jgi:hypothetical protein
MRDGNVSEIKRITEKSKQRTKDGRENASLRKDDAYVVDLIYLLEESVKIIDTLCDRGAAVGNDVLTVGQLHSIMGSIGDKNLEAYFIAKINEGIGISQKPEVPLIGEARIKG